MARLHRTEAGAHGVRRIARAQIAQARRALERRPLSDGAVHSARKSLKKARAMLRLLRPSIGDRIYHRENTALRDAARPLSEIRDATVLVHTLEQLVRHSRVPGPVSVTELHLLLCRQRAEVRRKLLHGPEPFNDLLTSLREVRCRAGRWRMGRKGWSVLGAGLTRVYGQARRAFARARADRAAASLHEWRKQTKYLWHQLQVLEPLGAAVVHLADRAHRLADVLGEDHDLWVLRATVATKVPVRSGRQTLLELIDRRSAQLRTQAIALGHQVYLDSEAAFAARLHALWRTWRRKPRHARAPARGVRSSSASRAAASSRS